MPTFIDEFVLATEPLTGVIPYFLLIVAKLCTSVRLDDHFEIWKNDVTEIRVSSDSNWILSDNVPRIETLDDPQDCCFEDVVTPPVGSSDDSLCARESVVSCVLRELP